MIIGQRGRYLDGSRVGAMRITVIFAKEFFDLSHIEYSQMWFVVVV